MKRSRILIVDDDDVDITLTLKVGIEENGFAVDLFNDPNDALANYKPHVYSLM